MRKTEIPRREWSGTLDELSRRHDGWLVTLDIATAPAVPAQPEFRQMPLVGITSEPADGGTIAIAVEEPGGEHLTHMIHEPTHVFIATTKTGADSTLEIASADGNTAVLHFRSGHAG